MTRILTTTANVNPETDEFPLAGEDLPGGALIEVHDDLRCYALSAAWLSPWGLYGIALRPAKEGNPVEVGVIVDVGLFKKSRESHRIVLRTLPDAVPGEFTEATDDPT